MIFVYKSEQQHSKIRICQYVPPGIFITGEKRGIIIAKIGYKVLLSGHQPG